jgi:hypothetical protein
MYFISAFDNDHGASFVNLLHHMAEIRQTMTKINADKTIGTKLINKKSSSFLIKSLNLFFIIPPDCAG